MTTPDPIPGLDAIRDRLDAATRGPWRVMAHHEIGGPDYAEVISLGPVECMAYCYGGSSRIEGDNLAADAELIAHAPADLAALLAEVERLTVQRNLLARALLDHASHGWDRASRDWAERDEARAERDAARAALAALVAWVADKVGYPVQMTMPDAPIPAAAAWDALVDHVHADASGDWHGNTLDREEVESWLAEEAGIDLASLVTKHAGGGRMSARVESIRKFTAYCAECDWEGHTYEDFEDRAGLEAMDHNDERHREDA